MTIKKRLYISFLLILSIIIFIIGIFFYAIINVNDIHLLQNQRYEQIRKVEKIKELNTAFAWLVLDIIVDRRKTEIVKDRKDKANELFKKLWQLKTDVLKHAETGIEKDKLLTIFNNLKTAENLIKVDLYNLTISKSTKDNFFDFSDRFDPISSSTQTLIIEEIELLQAKLNQTEKQKEAFLSKIKLELIILLFISFSLSFIISSKLIREIKIMLKTLNKGVLQLLSNNEKTIKINIEEGNELSEITNNLNKYLEQQEAFIKSREELLRNISHELKTPITKGKFLLEKIRVKKDEKSLDNINEVFYDIETLTSKLLERERLNHATLDKSKFLISTVILEALSKLSIDDESKISIELEDDFQIEADFYYLTIVIKNLIDNAMKYSNIYPIGIHTENKILYIKNNANKLFNDLNYYIQPFTREANQQQGHGLGLNIVNKILQMHNFNFQYNYKEPHNIFSIDFK